MESKIQYIIEDIFEIQTRGTVLVILIKNGAIPDCTLRTGDLVYIMDSENIILCSKIIGMEPIRNHYLPFEQWNHVGILLPGFDLKNRIQRNFVLEKQSSKHLDRGSI